MPVQLRVERLLFGFQRASGLSTTKDFRPQGGTNSPDADSQLLACLQEAGLGSQPAAMAHSLSALSTLTGDGALLRAQTAQPGE
jgi:hypothetical protein